MSKYPEEEYLMLSGIQHFYFCKRQWALIHIEQQWKENKSTQEGNILHEKADKPLLKESRKDTFISRAIPVSSSTLGFSGILDVVEFHQDETGVSLPGRKGKWKPEVIEYKRGKEKSDERDIVQLTAQVMCMEETLNCRLSEGYIYYFRTNQRIPVTITRERRDLVKRLAEEMHEMYRKKETPPAEFFKNCRLCSLVDICIPRMTKKKKDVTHYIYGDME